MPVWHKVTEAARKSEQLVVLGVIQEQHAERCRLYKQWQGFDWTIVQDSFNSLHARAVPMFVALDEDGVVRDNNLRTNELEAFLNLPAPSRDKSQIAQTKVSSQTVDSNIRTEAEDLLRWGDASKLTDAIEKFRTVLKETAEDEVAITGPVEFALGVAYRKRFDSEFAQPGDFQNAVQAWGRALDIDPNQYIYRRRIQQYGPRLIKPYPFYDWVEQAQTEIRQRGETPVKLAVALSGAEIAQPARGNQATNKESADSPDPENRILQDSGLIRNSNVVVPAAVKPGDAVRVHLSFLPQATAHWNNEAEPMLVWLDEPAGWSVSRQLVEMPQPKSAESNEERKAEFEIRSSQQAKSQTLKGFALYYICEELSGQCLFRRLDFQVNLEIKNQN